MVSRALRSTLRATAVFRVLLGLAAVLIAVLAAVTLDVAPAQAALDDPYPPTLPCTLSATPRDGTGSVELAVVGSGFGAGQQTDLVLRPTQLTLNSVHVDANGAFRTTLFLDRSTLLPASQLLAVSAIASCSVTLPNAGPSASGSHSAAPSTSSPSTSSSSAPGSSAPAPASPAASSIAPETAPSDGLGIPVGLTIAIAAGLVVLGLGATRILTRRS